MQAYLKNISTVMPFLRDNVNNPFGSQAFQQESVIGQDQAQRAGQRGVSNVTNNAAALGYSTNGGLFNSMLQRAGQNTSMMQGQAFRGAIGNAIGRQMSSAGMLSSFQPLMTGSRSDGTQTTSMSGLGTWLPQVVGAGLGAATSAFTGGMKPTGGSASSMGAGVGSTGSGMSSMFGGMNNIMGSPGYGYGAASSFQPNGAFLNYGMFGGR